MSAPNTLSDKPSDKTGIYIELALLIGCCWIIGIIAVYFLFIKKDKEEKKGPNGGGTGAGGGSTGPTGEPSKEIKTVTGNDGYVSCDRYCEGTLGKPWNNELPENWNGAKCVENGVLCKKRTGFPIKCTCEKAGGGWSTKTVDEQRDIDSMLGLW